MEFAPDPPPADRFLHLASRQEQLAYQVSSLTEQLAVRRTAREQEKILLQTKADIQKQTWQLENEKAAKRNAEFQGLCAEIKRACERNGPRSRGLCTEWDRFYRGVRQEYPHALSKVKAEALQEAVRQVVETTL